MALDCVGARAPGTAFQLGFDCGPEAVGVGAVEIDHAFAAAELVAVEHSGAGLLDAEYQSVLKRVQLFGLARDTELVVRELEVEEDSVLGLWWSRRRFRSEESLPESHRGNVLRECALAWGIPLCGDEVRLEVTSTPSGSGEGAGVPSLLR